MTVYKNMLISKRLCIVSLLQTCNILLYILTYIYINFLLLYSIKTVTVHTIHNITYCAFLFHLDNFLFVTPRDMLYVFYMLLVKASFLFAIFFCCVYFMKRKRIITVHFIEYWVGESDGARYKILYRLFWYTYRCVWYAEYIFADIWFDYINIYVI